MNSTDCRHFTQTLILSKKALRDCARRANAKARAAEAREEETRRMKEQKDD